MNIDVKLPDLGDGIESGDVLEVLVREGDQIGKDQGLIELETDKATVEVPSTHAGTIVKVHVSAGQTIPVGSTLITLEVNAPVTKASPPAAPPTEVERGLASSPTDSLPPAPTTDVMRAPPRPTAPSNDDASEPAFPATSVSPRSGAATGTTVAAGPAIRRFAREVGVDLSLVRGTGSGGRITRNDVLEVVRQANKAALGGPSGPSESSKVQLPGKPSSDAWGEISIEPLTKIRKTIAAKMHESWSSIPRVTNFDDADVTELEKIRQASKSDYAGAGIKLTSTPFVIKAVAMALNNHAHMNASLDPENNQVIYKQYVNIGIAVDTQRGLVVPALRHADKLSVAGIAKALAALADKARNNEFAVEDLRGGTFTISNLGAIGGTYSTPIINAPEVAILLVGRSRKMPVVIDDQVAVRLMMPLSVSYDHRLVDGATAARFLNEVIGFLQAPGRLLLAP